MKPFLITVDTEGDNQWKTWAGEETTTENAKYIPRFQSLCEEFGFKPVYLVTYEMVNDPFLSAFLKKKASKGKCEIGMHLHAWSSPPLFELVRRFPGNPYITEYPEEIMYEKMSVLTEHIERNLEIHPVSHRAGRWASSDAMFSVLNRLQYKVDCSVVSGWNAVKLCGQTTDAGFDYSRNPQNAYWVTENILEVPMVVKNHRSFSGKHIRSKVRNIIKGKDIWLRPAVSSLKQMEWALDSCSADYSMFMIHSTELMPGGSPYFATADDVEAAYTSMEHLFEYAANTHVGITLEEYFNLQRSRKDNLK